ncbi:MAG: hypothetical protein ACJ79P_24970 [Myxococcales bacterium]
MLIKSALGVVVLALMALGCATARWPPAQSEKDSAEQIVSVFKDETVQVELRPEPVSERREVPARDAAPASLREPVGGPDPATPKVGSRTIDLHLEGIDSVAVRGRAGDRPLEIPLQQVRSISRTQRVPSALMGGILGIPVGALIGYGAASASDAHCGGTDSLNTCAAGAFGGAVVGVILGAVVGAVIGYKTTLLVEPP